MTFKLAIVPLVLGALLMSTAGLFADDPTTTPGTTPDTTKPSTTDSTTTHKYHKATNIINGKVDKISENSITLKITYQTGKPNVHHANQAHISGGWLPRIVPGPAPRPNPKARVHTVTQSITYEIGEIPPVKVVTDGPHPSRTTGAYTDVKVGDLVTVGTAPLSTKTGEGKTTTHVQVTGIDVYKHAGAANTPTTPKPPQ
jgi:hypothetical protein